MSDAKNIVRAAQILVGLNALIWLVVAVVYLLRYAASDDIPLGLVILIALGMAVFGALLLLLGIRLSQRRKAVVYAALCALMFSLVLPIFDDFGWVDFLAALPALIAAIYLLLHRKELIAIPNQPQAAEQGGY